MTADGAIWRTGRVVKVTVTADGEPICPYCGRTTVTDDGGLTWQCPGVKFWMQAAIPGLVAAFDQAVEEADRG